MSDPVITARYYHPLNLEHLGITYRDTLVAYHGPLRRFVCPGRLVALVPGRVWPAADPEHCRLVRRSTAPRPTALASGSPQSCWSAPVAAWTAPDLIPVNRWRLP